MLVVFVVEVEVTGEGTSSVIVKSITLSSVRSTVSTSVCLLIKALYNFSFYLNGYNSLSLSSTKKVGQCFSILQNKM